MPFELNEYDRAAMVRWRAALEALLPVLQPDLLIFEVREVATVPVSSVDVGADAPVEIAPVHLEQTVSFDPGRIAAGDLMAVLEPLVVAASTVARERVRFMKTSLDALTDATGQVVRASGGMSWETVMRMIEGSDVAFGEDGEPTFVIWPLAARRRYEALLPRTPAEERRWQELMTSKREETDARQRHRRLGR